MGQLISKKPKLEINEADRAVLTLKSQARKLEQQRQRIQGNIDRETAVARELVAAGKKGRALLALKRRRLQESQASKLDAWLLNVEEMLANIETTKNQQRLFAALKEGNSALKEMQKEMPLEDVEKLMQDSADAKAYEDSLRQLLGESLNPEEAEAAEAELQQMEAELLEEQRLEMPRVPGKPLPAAPEAAPAAGEQQQQQQQPEAAATAEALAQLPAVPTSKVQLPAEEAEGAAEAEPERVLVAA